MTTQPSSARIALAWLPAALYLALIWWLSSQQLVFPLDRIPWRDKGLHAIEYGVLGACFAEAVWITWHPLRTSARGLPAAILAWLFTAASGLLDELHQAYVPGRSADIRDLAADTLGAAVGVLLVFALRAILRARAVKRDESAIHRA